ncbi:YhcN/YlaJ family sporulation lipoprotein [Paenibacillus sp.]|jgi:hypothetical protein|uniref:YhcN/YlaJ family sporulation lipoprotein n=1 Tax=Paenibacillus sp. TaxID=58172 RepID=UPI002836B4FC|nr:YhcN/YlaJ family sporulation lipoprotein [Paenibacillus sp.]MDR0266991.1 YhcN/YlaJ family sporulation lipoprotein [Paenibacillus sp.]
MMRSKVISLSLSAALLVSVAGVTGCFPKQPANTNVHTKNVRDGRALDGRINVNSLRDGGRYSTYNTDGHYGTYSSRHDLSNLTSGQHIADKVAAMKEVRTANVLKAGNSAYVAVSLEPGIQGKTSTTGTHGQFRSNSFGTMNNSSFNNNSLSNNSITNGSAVINHRSIYGTQGGYGATGTNQTDGNLRPYTTSSGEPITRISGFNATTPGTSGTFQTYSQNYNVGAHIKTKIDNCVKKADPSIKNVYVSANPDFVQRVNNYAADLKNGHPIRGAVSEFSTMVERIFPLNTGTTNRVTPFGTTPTPTAPLGRTPAGRNTMY